MSIDRETFQTASEAELSGLSVPQQVLGFLSANSDRAFTASEIAARVDCSEGAVSTALSRLKNRELVEHKATYWAITEDDSRLHSYDGYERATAHFNEQLGTEYIDEWRSKAPDEPHPSLTEET